MADAGKTPVSLDNLRRFREKSAYGEATPGAAGLMSAADKAKLDGIAEGTNRVYVAKWVDGDWGSRGDKLPMCDWTSVPFDEGALHIGRGVTVELFPSGTLKPGDVLVTPYYDMRQTVFGPSAFVVKSVADDLSTIAVQDGPVALTFPKYKLPATTADKLGGMKPGTGLTAASDGTVSLAYGTDEEFLAYVLGESSTASEVG